MPPACSPVLIGVVALLPAFAGMAWLAGCSESAVPARPSEWRNILLISIDTCRADHLSCYGATHVATPHIDAVAREGVLFENAIAPVPLTLPSHCTLLTGTNPPYHGVHDNAGFRLGPSHMTLAEILKEQGFTTGAVIAASVLKRRCGLDQGFDDFGDAFKQSRNTIGIFERWGEEVSDEAGQWIEAHADDPFFLFVHYYDPHYPYEPPPPFSAEDRHARYAGEIAYTDRCIGNLLTKLRQIGAYDSTLIVITSDHGEMLGEHGETVHGFLIYQSVMRVPLLVRLPGGRAGRRVEGVVGLIDILPTVCGLLGIEPPEAVAGRDLSDVLAGDAPAGHSDRAIYCESLYARKYDANPLLGLVTARWKYILTTRPELYDLVDDPKELNNVVAAQGERAAAMHERLRQIIDRSRRHGEAESKLHMRPHEMEQLMAVGYVGGILEGEQTFDIDPNLDDPKDLREFHSHCSRLGALSNTDKDDEFLAQCRRVMAMRPAYADPHRMLGDYHQKRGRVDEAIAAYRKAIALDPGLRSARNNLAIALAQQGDTEGALELMRRELQIGPDLNTHFNLGKILTDVGELEEAIAHLRTALRLDPHDIDVRHHMGAALEAAGRIDEAELHYHQVLRVEPEAVETRKNLAGILAQRGEHDRAIAHLRRVLEKQGDDFDTQNKLGVTLASAGRFDEAVDLFRQVLARRPDDHDALCNLGSALSHVGELDEALEHFRHALRIDPSSVRALYRLAWFLATHPDAASRRPEEAIQFAQRALALTGNEQPQILDALAAAHAAAGRYDRAVEHAEKAEHAARRMQADELSRQIAARLERYRQGQPYHEGVTE